MAILAAATLAVVGLVTATGLIASAAAAGPRLSGYTVTDLDAGFTPTAVSDARLIVGYEYGNYVRAHSYVWRNGTISALRPPAALPGYMLDGTYEVPRLDAAGDIAQSFVDDKSGNAVDVPYVWTVGTDGRLVCARVHIAAAIQAANAGGMTDKTVTFALSTGTAIR